MDLLDLDDDGLRKLKGLRYILNVVDTFCTVVWTAPLKNKYFRSTKYSF